MNLDTATQQELLDLLAPLVEREQDRRDLLALALGTDAPALGGIEWGGSVERFILRMSAQLAHFGEVGSGEQALWRLLETVRERVPADRQARIDALKPIVNRCALQANAAVSSSVTGKPLAAPLRLRVFLASPGDVADERALARQVLDQLPYDPLLRRQVVIEAVAWDQLGAGVPMLATMTPQTAIARGLPKPSECDLVVVILWARMGRVLPPEYRKPDGSPYLSGTEWEYLDALREAERNGKPEILVYRRTEKCLLDTDDPEFDDKRKQRQQVKAFFATFDNRDGSIKRGRNDYATPEEFRRQLELHLRSIITRLLDDRSSGVDESTGTTGVLPPPMWKGSPFPGLRAFTPDDAPIFFGRGRETDELVRRFADVGTRLTVIVGASGSGKSSLVAAGLLPRLAANAIEGSKDWVLPHVLETRDGRRKQWAGLRLTPGEFGENPFQALAAKLAPLLPDESMTPREVAEQLEGRAGALVHLIDAALQGKPHWAELMMFVDQFEELFSVVVERYRESFIDMLASAARMARVRIVATIRAEFYHRCLDWPKLAAILRDASFPLAAPGLVALFEMVTGPAARAGLVYDDGLPIRILSDTGTDPGSLALLAFALHELSQASGLDGRLTQSAYDAFGGVRGAISQRAEATFARLSFAARDALFSVLRELVEVDERGAATRRRVLRERLVHASELVDAFTKARLLVSDQSQDGQAVVEVAHEALLREWPRVRNWVSVVADQQRLWRQVEVAAIEWQRAGREPAYLWPHERLVLVYEALEQLGIDPARVDEPLRSFIRPEAERLLEELERSETMHYRRAQIGDRLDSIGDPRPGVGVRADGVPDIVWCRVPAGTVTLREGAGTFRVEPFCIAKYPLTYRQYQVFLNEPEGYGDERWWGDLKYDLESVEQKRQVGNCPTERVSWYDAMAYCRWLSGRLGYEVRLPTEWEWQQAASGGQAYYEYPWGSDWLEGRANTAESRLGRTTAVGMYPGGAPVQNHSEGPLDLVGNVLEWCLNKYAEPSDISPGGEDPRALRGGSWDLGRDDARCTYRSGSRPDDRSYDGGFRLVCATPMG